jgi:hypothetical protein
MDDVQGVDFLERVQPIQGPVHHADYGVFRSPLADFVVGTRRSGHCDIRVVRPGERADLVRRGDA